MLENLTIKKRLTLLITMVSAVAIVATTITMTVIGIYNIRASLVGQLVDTASNVGQSNLAYISFAQKDVATHNLHDVFVSKSSILRVCMYDYVMGDVAASYISDGEADKSCPAMNDMKEGVSVNDGNTVVVEPLSVNNQKTALILIESDMREIRTYLMNQVSIAFSITLLVVAVAYMLALAMQGTISDPVRALANTVRRVSVEKDYALRVDYEHDSSSKNEVFMLIDAINEMLEEIQERDRRLLKQNEELGKAKKSAESASVAKSHFLANISHELRTPLNAIIGFSSVFKEQLFGKLGNDKYMEYANDINDAGAHLLDIINDILDLSKTESGRMVLVFENVDVRQCVNKCISVMSRRAADGQVTVTSSIQEDLPTIIADRLRFSQIILNVLSNAIKFTAAGGSVSITVTSEMRNGITTDFFIKIRDTGIGMAQENISKVFQSFDQVDSGLNRKYGGTGLGLPLTKNLIALHHGNISVESELGVGTEVTLHFMANPTFINDVLDLVDQTAA